MDGQNERPCRISSDLMTPKDVAKALSMSTAWVRDHAAPKPGRKPRRHPVIPVIRLGSTHRAELRFRREDIETFLKNQYITGEGR